MEAVSNEGLEEKGYMTNAYEEILDELNVSSEAKRSIRDTIDYWKYIYGFAKE